jgi:hypothetical protein
MITCLGLEKLGFLQEKDFILQDLEGSFFIKEWLSKLPQPSEEELNTASISAQAEYDAHAWERSRQAEYPSLLELTVALYDTDDKSAVEAKRAAVKLKYPKPE